MGGKSPWSVVPYPSLQSQPRPFNAPVFKSRRIPLAVFVRDMTAATLRSCGYLFTNGSWNVSGFSKPRVALPVRHLSYFLARFKRRGGQVQSKRTDAILRLGSPCAIFCAIGLRFPPPSSLLAPPRFHSGVLRHIYLSPAGSKSDDPLTHFRSVLFGALTALSSGRSAGDISGEIVVRDVPSFLQASNRNDHGISIHAPDIRDSIQAQQR